MTDVRSVAPPGTGQVTNRLYDDLVLGESARIERRVTEQDLYLFAHASGNMNPMHLPGRDVDGDGAADTVAPSMWVGSLVSALLGNVLPGPGTLYRTQSFAFTGRAQPGDTLVVEVRVQEKLAPPRVRFTTTVGLKDGPVIARGEAEVDAPAVRIAIAKERLPSLMLDDHDHFGRLLGIVRQLAPLVTAVVCPDDHNALGGALLSMKEGLISPVFIGARDSIRRAADDLGKDIGAIPIIDVADHGDAAAHAVAMANAGEARAVMKGNVHSDELLAHVVKKDGLRVSGRRISHVFVMDVPGVPHPLFISDAAINIAPDLMTKADIIQNAIDLAVACGIAEPKVGLLSAVETVNVNIPSTLDAAILSKMAERGQIKGGIVDGPLAMDNAVDLVAARTKGIRSAVAGRAEVLIVPNMEAGNMLAKQLTFLAKAEPAGLVVGAKVPVMLTSRADNDRARLASCTLALLYDAWKRDGHAFTGVLAKAAE